MGNVRGEVEGFGAVEVEVEGRLGGDFPEAGYVGAEGEAGGGDVGVGGEDADLGAYFLPGGLGFWGREVGWEVFGSAGRVGDADPALGGVCLVDADAPLVGFGGGDAHDEGIVEFHRAGEGEDGSEVESEPVLAAGDVFEEAGAGFQDFQDGFFEGGSGGGSDGGVGGGSGPGEGDGREPEGQADG